MAMNITQIIQKARESIHIITSLPVSSTLSINAVDHGWEVTMELVEKKSIPECMDILATYETIMDPEGNMMEFRRTRLRKRSDTADSDA